MKGVNAQGVRTEVTEHISRKLSDVGILFRIFSRTKEKESIDKKINSDSDYGKTKKLQDLIGIRVVLYFSDDIETVRNIISSDFNERDKDVSIDEVKNDEFKAIRYNIVYSLSETLANDMNLEGYEHLIDTTFELQIRSIFSEGWHEVEHDLRYKCKSDWIDHDYQSRKLNGVYASLETSEWTMIKIFDELAYSHYKKNEWSAMFRQKFRLRFVDSSLNSDLENVFVDKELVKRFFRLDRSKMIMELSRRGFYYPLSLSNFIYFANIIKIKDERILKITPTMMIEDMTP